MALEPGAQARCHHKQTLYSQARVPYILRGAEMDHLKARTEFWGGETS